MNAINANPFALMLTPQQVLQAVEGSTALRGLRQQQYLLLDRPASMVAHAAVEFDAIDDADEDLDDTMTFDETLISESVSGSHSYQSFPRVFN